MKLKNVIKASISKTDSFQAGNIQNFLEIWKRITSDKYITSTLSKCITSTLTSGKNYFIKDWCLMSSQPTFLFFPKLNLMNFGHIIKSM